ncbi:MAG TPA: energy transducer TonB [Bacteroidales bacterium]|nr:energy transducer TonB [Bacteroidales bacterium]
MMRKKNNTYPGLDEIAFENRNQSYGSYFLRRKYYRYLLYSTLGGIVVFILAALIPFFVYFLEPPPFMIVSPEVEYYSLQPPTEEDLAQIEQMIAKPPPEATPAPVVTDTVTQKEIQKPQEEKPEEQHQETADTSQSAGNGNGGENKGVGDESGIYTTLDVYPQYPGGDRARLYFIRSNIRYPDAALKGGIQGVVIILFVIEKDGSISNIQVTKSIGSGCDEEAVRVTKSMPFWEPGKRNGKPVRVLVKMPIVFRIPGKPG